VGLQPPRTEGRLIGPTSHAAPAAQYNHRSNPPLSSPADEKITRPTKQSIFLVDRRKTILGGQHAMVGLNGNFGKNAQAQSGGDRPRVTAPLAQDPAPAVARSRYTSHIASSKYSIGGSARCHR